MIYRKINPVDFPLKEKESWWIVHPNSKGGEFIIPDNACTACLHDIEGFNKGTIYNVSSCQNEGWVHVASNVLGLEMPQYLFGRHFDAEIFVRGTPTQNEIDTVLSPYTINKVNPSTGKWID